MKPELLELVLRTRRTGFNIASNNYPFNDQRGLTKNEYSPLGYNEVLPKYKGKTLIDLIQEKIDANSGTGQKIRILDLGCGPQANFLRDCREKWGEAIERVGIGARITLKTDELENLKEQGITILHEDLQGINEHIDLGSVDIAVASKSFPYLSDPIMALIALNSTLKDDGIALVSDFPISPLIEGLDGNNERLERFIRYLQSLDIEVNLHETSHRFGIFWEGHLAFAKIPKMSLPLRYSGRTKEVNIQLPGQDAYTFQALTYLLDQRFV